MKKNIFFLVAVFLLTVPSQGQETTYELEWATYLPTTPLMRNGIAHITNEGDSYVYFYENYNVPNPTDFDAWLTDDAYYTEPYSFGDQGYMSKRFWVKIDADQNHVYGSYVEPFFGSFSSINHNGE